jgi:sRNA-binding carbon storage regulator CsrA
MGKLRVSRKREEGVWIGRAHVRVAKCGKRTTLEITAPDDVGIYRDELVPELLPAKPEVKRAS